MLDQTAPHTSVDQDADAAVSTSSIAIIGMSGRFPNAADLEEFWDNLISGRDCISRFSVEDLERVGLDPVLLSNPKYIRAKGVLEDPLAFDASLFGFSPYEAEVIDPQQRIFLECAMSALEDAGCNPDTYDGSVGIYAGQAMSSYIFAILSNQNAKIDPFLANTSNDKDFLCSRIAYKLNLRGPCVAVAASCATSLVAVTMACQSLLDYQCDVAISGGVCVTFPAKEGYMHDEGSNVSADGYCRAFDEKATGLVGGNGAGAIVLKRLEDAIADRDNIHAVIRSCAINNDGATKVGYTAPSVEGQAEVITLTHALGDIDPGTISYVEAHGTGTRLGDPIEIAGLTRAFRRKTDKTGFCGIGSVKTNIGHLDAAAGMAGLIKTVLAMKHRTIPPSLHFDAPNPQIDFAASPFYVCDKPTPWDTDLLPRRAGINSSAIGGNNAHLVLEEAPPAQSVAPDRELSVLTLSANSADALKRTATRLASALGRNQTIEVADAAYSLQVGRKGWKHRLAVVARDSGEAADLLTRLSGKAVVRGQVDTAGARPAFLFPGQGAQHVGMMRGIYESEPVFRKTLDECADLLVPEIGVDLRTLIFAPDGDETAAAELDQTRLTQPALFAVEYSLAQLWKHWGVQPTAMLGHSIGEYVAACISGVMSLPDALRLVSRRGALMQSLPPGSMVSVPLPDHELNPLLTAGLSLAAVLAPSLCVVAGKKGELDALEQRLSGFGVECQPIRTSHAFHSQEMEPILEEFTKAFEGITLNAPQIPFVSNLTGTWITPAEAMDPTYWAKQLRGMVRLRDGLRELTAASGVVCVEVGPGRSLSALSQQAVEGRKVTTVTSCRNRLDSSSDVATLLAAVGKLWTVGGAIDWEVLSHGKHRRKVPLPTYPFEREEYSLLPARNGPPGDPEGAGRENRPVADLLYAPTWKQSAWPAPALAADDPDATWLCFVDPHGVGMRCAARLDSMHHRVVTVALDSDEASGATYRASPRNPDDFKRIFDELAERGQRPTRILHFWTVGSPDGADASAKAAGCRVNAFDSLLHMVQGMGTRDTHAAEPILLSLVSTGLADVAGHEAIEPEKSLLIGPLRVIPVEYPHIKCKSIDLSLQDVGKLTDRDIDRLLSEALQKGPVEVALRRDRRWVRSFESIYFNPHGDVQPELPTRLRELGTYLITGGLGGIGLEIAVHLARQVGARLILTARSTVDLGAPAPLGTRPPAEAIAAIEAAGGQVMIGKADVTDRAAMVAVIEEAVERFGPIHGVIHAAGVAGRGIMQLKTSADVDRVLAPKVDGTLVLDEIFAKTRLDFMALCSSIATVVGAPGQAEYTSANAYLDAFVQARRDSDTRYVSINWDRWAEVGMAVKENTEAHEGMQALAPEAGVQAFDLALGSSEQQIAVALGPFEWISRYGPPRQRAAANGHDGGGGGGGGGGGQPTHKRPDLDTIFEAPTNELETAIAGLFGDVLGIKDIGIDDNFFDLGGHSLLGVQLVNRIQEIHGVRIGIGELFNLPSVRSLSTTIVARRANPQDGAAAGPA